MQISKNSILSALIVLFLASSVAAQNYTPSNENLQARKEFEQNRFGIFLHWGIYSMFAQGEWYLQNAGLDKDEYAKAASAFYPHNFDAKAWVSAIKASGAKYICFTTRHHDGFSMWDTDESDYNIVDSTPFARDVVRELADECHRQGINLHFYYSLIDWTREDYPLGRTARKVKGRDKAKEDWDSYFGFMNRQLTELLTEYGEVDAIWFDGVWDHDQDTVAFDWQFDEQYAMIHKLQPGCLIGNNHHITPFEGEDIQIFERDLPGENKAGLSGQDISRLPLETCQTMNGMWGYKVADQNYKSVETLIRYLVSTAGKGANLLLNIGPQPDGSLPAAALERLEGIGEWMEKYGQTVYGTSAGDVPAQDWGVTTRKGDRLFVHIFDHKEKTLDLPLNCKVKSACLYDGRKAVKYHRTDDGMIRLTFDQVPHGVDYIIEIQTR